MFKPLAKLLKALSSNRDPGAIACAFALGMMLGFMPKDNALWYILFIFIFFLRIQRGALVLAMILGSLLAPLLDPSFDRLGYYILDNPSLRDTFITLLDIPFVSFTKFNNTIVMGSFVVGLAACIPFYLAARLFIFVWRHYVGNFMRKFKLFQMIKQVPLVEKITDFIEEV